MLRDFSADVFKTAQEIEVGFRKKVLIERIKAEKEKQQMLKNVQKDFDLLSDMTKRH